MGMDFDAQAMALKALGRSERKPWGALSTVKALLAAGLDCTLGIWTDSIGNEAGDGIATLREWPYLLADRLAAAYPAYKVQVIRWPLTSATAYDPAPVAIQTPAGSPPTLTIYNAAIAGSPTMYLMGSSWLAALVSPPLDALLISHGQNHVYPDVNGAVDATKNPTIRGEIIAAVEQFKLHKPGVAVDLILENPRRTDELMQPVNAAWRRAAQVRDLGLIDVYAGFVAAGRAAALYQTTGDPANDIVHPGQAGSALYRDTIWTAFSAAEPCFTSPLPSLLLPGAPEANLLVNGGFSAWATAPGAPDGWSAGTIGGGTLTAARETGVVADSRLGYSVRLTSTGGSCYLQQIVSSSLRNQIAGRRATLAVKRCLGAASPAATLGRIELYVAGTATGTTLYASRPFVTRQDGWHWTLLSGVPVPTDCTALAVRLYHDNAAAPGATPVYYDQATLTAGYLPGGVR